MAGWCDTYRGMVYPWQCDHQGHLTTMHYLGIFDQAGWHLLNRHGLGPEALADAGRGYVDAKDTIEYVTELRVGALVEVASAFSRIGTSSIGLVHRMRLAATGLLAARCEMIAVHFDLVARTKLPIPEDVRARLADHIVDPTKN
ncbi:MAG: acyl-CoA thioesterase [Alphaproteobacteria bacterium]|nr:acyl-CoA thioesterase [Alphaproteobacteria bacterium]